MDLQDPTRKMSTTGGSEEGTVYVLDEPKVIEKKLKRAVTDSDDPPAIRRGEDKPGVTNLIDLLAACSGRTPDAGRGVDWPARAATATSRPRRRRGRDRRAGADPRALRRAAPRRGARSRRCSRAAPSRRARSRRRRSPTCAPRWPSAPPAELTCARAALTSARRARWHAARLVALIGAIVLVDTLLYAALAPLLPALEDEFGALEGRARACSSAPTRSARSSARCPGGLAAARCGPRAVVLAGLALMTVSGVVVRARATTRRASTSRASARGSAARRRGPPAWPGWARSPRASGAARRSASRSARAIFGAQFGPVVGVDRRRARARADVRGGRGARARARAAGARREPRAAGAGGRGRLAARCWCATAPFVAAAWLTFLPSLAFGVGRGARAAAARRARRRARWRSARRSSSRRSSRRSSARSSGASPTAAASARSCAARRSRAAARSRCSPCRTSALLVAALLVVAAVALGRAVDAERQHSCRCAPSTLGVDQGWAFALNNLGWAGGRGDRRRRRRRARPARRRRAAVRRCAPRCWR